MTALLVDTSVLIKWFHAEGESELAPARAIRDAHVGGRLDAHVLDLALYEVGDVLVRALRWTAEDVSDQLDDLVTIVGTPITMAPSWMRAASTLAEQHSLSFYDASWAATAAALDLPLVTADRRLLATGLAQSASTTASRLGLTG